MRIDNRCNKHGLQRPVVVSLESLCTKITRIQICSKMKCTNIRSKNAKMHRARFFSADNANNVNLYLQFIYWCDECNSRFIDYFNIAQLNAWPIFQFEIEIIGGRPIFLHPSNEIYLFTNNKILIIFLCGQLFAFDEIRWMAEPFEWDCTQCNNYQQYI